MAKTVLPIGSTLIVNADGNWLFRVPQPDPRGRHYFVLADGEEGYIDDDLNPDEDILCFDFFVDYGTV